MRMSPSDRRHPDDPATSCVHAAGRALDRAGIGWALLREPVRGEATHDDVDLLVAAGRSGELDALLAAVGYRRLPGAGQGSHRFYLAYDPPRDEWVTLDVVTEVAFGRRLELATATAGDLLHRARRIGGMAVLEPDDAFWHRLLHQLLDKEAVSPQSHATLTALASQARAVGPLARVVDELRPGGRSASAVRDLVATGDAPAIGALAADVRRAWRRRDRRQVWARALRSRLARAHLAGPAPTEPTGLAVAILGPDGAGKTTLAEALTRSLPLPTRLVYMGVWRDYPWDRPLRFVPGARLALRCGRLTARSLELSYHRRRGRVVLLDRFTYDAALPSDDLDWRGKLTAAVTGRLSRAPDAVLLLDAPAEVMYARKGEQGLSVLARDRSAYRRLVAGHGRATVIDATLPAVQVRAHAHEALWQLLAPAGL
jgi:thymidylate kinase